ncbi:1065_t:CDS:1 [Cetraspora pellucida]|uniref:1065_t:CDS:1 n=1 Tax=Cetraspora pellucida TaxID=1433469 RepID=A0A9N9HUQ8_9GLOM|nr:1065_t:CDS:1 [Cetraspora pellucida]
MIHEITHCSYHKLLKNKKRKLSENEIDEIVKIAIDYWGYFHQQHPWRQHAIIAVKEFVNWINNNDIFWGFNNKKFIDFKHNIKNQIGAITENAINLNPYYYAERVLHEISHYVYQKILDLNKKNDNYISPEECNQIKIELKNNILTIDQILINLNIEFSADETSENKLNKLLEYSNQFIEY